MGPRLEATRDAYGEALVEVGGQVPEIVVLDADLSVSTKTSLFARKFPERFFQMGISEADMMDTAAGLAVSGKIPFVSTFAVFGTGKGWEQIRNTVAMANLPVRICLTHGGLSVGEDGASAQANEDIAIMRAIPNMRVIVPADGVETRGVIRYLATHLDGPAYVRLGRPKVPVVCSEGDPFELGRARRMREGRDVSLIACGQLVALALAAAETLAGEGIEARVIDMASVKPLDREAILAAARETKGIVTAEEHSVIGGLGGAVAEIVGEERPCLVRRVGVRDLFGTSGTAEELFRAYGLTPEAIVQAARGICRRDRDAP